MPITVVTEPTLMGALEAVVTARTPTVFVGIYSAQFRMLAADRTYRHAVSRSVTYPDGKGVVRELQLRGVSEAERLATTDTVHPMARLAAENGWRVALYGAAPGVAERAKAELLRSAPGLEVIAHWDGYSRGPSIEDLRRLSPDMVFVGVGAPRQEAWGFEVAVPAGVPAVITCGGLLDFLAGDKRRAPLWIRRVGLEWLFRSVLEPRRLLLRYVVGNSYFLWHARRDRRRAGGLAEPDGH